MTELSVPAVVMMTAIEARAETEKAKREVVRGFGRLAAIRDREGWRALKFPTWSAYLEAEWGLSRNYANKLIDHTKFVGEIEAAAGTIVPGLTEGATRVARSQRRSEATENAATAAATLPLEEVPGAVREDVTVPQGAGTPVPTPDPPPAEQKRAPTPERHSVTHDLTDSEWSALLDLAVAASQPHEAEATKLLRAAIRLATLAAEAGVVEPVRFLERDLAAFVETGEVVNRPKTSGRAEQRQPAAPAPSNGECRHVASKPKSSGLVVCELCGLPRTRWSVAATVAGAGPRVERSTVDVPTAFKGSGKK